MSNNDYDQQVEEIQAYNKPILEAFEAWLAESWTKKTVKKHVDNIYFFTDYLVYYEPLRRLDEATESDVFTFLSSWFPRKALWASTSNMKAYISSFKKLFKWMGETKRMDAEEVEAIFYTLKEERDVFLEAVEDDVSFW